jgi:hypothetical protein
VHTLQALGKAMLGGYEYHEVRRPANPRGSRIPPLPSLNPGPRYQQRCLTFLAIRSEYVLQDLDPKFFLPLATESSI